MAGLKARRFSGASIGLVIGHVAPEASVGGPIVVIREGDTILVDLNTDGLDCRELANNAEYTRRTRVWQEEASRNGGVHPDVKPVDNRLLARMRSPARSALQCAGMAPTW